MIFRYGTRPNAGADFTPAYCREIHMSNGLARFTKVCEGHRITKVHDLSGAHHRIGMYLAGILGLCALLHVPANARVGSEFSTLGTIAAYSYRQNPAQQPAKPDTQESQPAQPKQDAAPSAPQQDQPSQPPPANTPAAAPPSGTEQSPAKPKPAVPAKKSSAKKKHPAKAASDEPQKRVIHRGSTVEPTTQLSPGITDEQAARQRESTNKLLASTDASLQKLSGRQLTKDEQDTVTQIRRFMQQVKKADADGDLQRAYKLAVKARLLSDALAKP
jgi:outer membrane biosynthesis protein TonB